MHVMSEKIHVADIQGHIDSETDKETERSIDG